TSEIEPGCKAAEEIEDLWKYINKVASAGIRRKNSNGRKNEPVSERSNRAYGRRCSGRSARQHDDARSANPVNAKYAAADGPRAARGNHRDYGSPGPGPPSKGEA